MLPYNHLINEKSPYLQQHARQPVDWYPWCDEAFERAQSENKPVFVSIGYATCHWCHVMAEESFADQQIADLLNESFISIKVDREERPDIDAIYMKVCQAMTGQGGWPLNVFMTPWQKPFYTGTYFPKQSRYQMPGMVDVLTQLSAQFYQQPDKINRISEQITEAIQFEQKQSPSIDEQVIHDGFAQLQSQFDSENGGFGRTPKFPAPHQLMFLLQYHRWQQDADALSMVTKTLDHMAAGGIYDHIGYGFARYAVDEQWHVPHFEKMLYDQAMMVMAYIEGYQTTQNNDYKHIVQNVLHYVERVMLDNHGGFYSAEDADSNGSEGAFYIWTYEEIIAVLGTSLGELFCRQYHVSPHGQFAGANILHVHPSDENILTSDQLQEAKQKLFAAREKRVHPEKDDKILTSWNGLMIAAFAKAGRVFQDKHYEAVAQDALRFIDQNLWQDQRLMARFRHGEVRYPGYLDDYSYLLWAYIEMYECSLAPYYLERSHDVAEQMKALFWDETTGGFYFTGSDQEALIARSKEWQDGAVPSGNSVAAYQLLRLAGLTGQVVFEEWAEAIFTASADMMSRFASGFCHMLSAFLLLHMPRQDIVVFGDEAYEDYQKMRQVLQQAYLPEMTYLIHHDCDELRDVAPFTQHFSTSQPMTAYVCKNHTCQRPTHDMEQVLRHLGMVE